METVTKLAEENLTETQQWQKQWYDRIAHEWGLQPDDEVLVPQCLKTLSSVARNISSGTVKWTMRLT